MRIQRNLLVGKHISGVRVMEGWCARKERGQDSSCHPSSMAGTLYISQSIVCFAYEHGGMKSSRGGDPSLDVNVDPWGQHGDM